MSLLQDFKKFALKGNVLDLAVAVVMGAAFARIVTATVDDLFMPVVGALLPGGEWRAWTLTPLNIRIGAFLGSTIDLLIVSAMLFGVVRISARLQRREDATRECPRCLEQVPSKATRCKACTSELEAVPVARVTSAAS